MSSIFFLNWKLKSLAKKAKKLHVQKTNLDVIKSITVTPNYVLSDKSRLLYAKQKEFKEATKYPWRFIASLIPITKAYDTRKEFGTLIDDVKKSQKQLKQEIIVEKTRLNKINFAKEQAKEVERKKRSPK